jgi:hypothetical protein
MEPSSSKFKRNLDEPALVEILGVLADGICAKDIETKHNSLVKIMKLLELDFKNPVEFVSFEVGEQTFNLQGMTLDQIVALIKEVERSQDS